MADLAFPQELPESEGCAERAETQVHLRQRKSACLEFPLRS